MSNINTSTKDLRREMGKKSIEAFARFYFPHYFKKSVCGFHIELYEMLLSLIHKKGRHIAIAAPRESAKSSIVSLFYVVWCICYQKESYIILLSNTNTQAATLLSHVKKELESNPSLIENFPEICGENAVARGFVWKEDEIITANKIKITALGAGQKIRGRRNKEFRPSLVILDDIEEDKSVRSQEQREKLYEWFTKAVLKSGNENTNYLVIGTILSYDSLLARLTSPSQAREWEKSIYKSVISWAKNSQLWLTWENILNYKESYLEKEGEEGALLFYMQNESAMSDGTKVLWPDMENYYKLMLARNYNEISFSSEKQNEPINPDMCPLNMDEAHFWDDEFKSEEELLKKLGQDVEIIGACDPSLGLKGKKGDYSAIVTLVKDNATGCCYVLDADIEKRDIEDLYKTIISHCDYRRYRTFVIENNQFQAAIVYEINKRCEEMGINVNIEGITNASDKIGRIQLLQSPIKRGKIKFSRKHVRLIEQLKYFPRGSHDDGPDALEMAYKAGESFDGRVRWLPITGGGGPDVPGSTEANEHDRLTKDPDVKEYGDNYNIYDDGEDD